jgi:hypothetical protein
MHVNHLGVRTNTDWDLLKVIAKQDWVLVTNNAIEFRGRYRAIELHPGVVFLVTAVRREEQIRLYKAALDYIGTDGDMANRAIDVAFDLNRVAIVTAYDLP